MNTQEPVTKLHAGDIERLERRAHAMIATMAEAREVETDRRDGDRQRYLALARLRRTDGGETGQELTLYTRDLTGDGVGYIAAGDLPADVRATISLPGPAGQPIEAAGQVIRTQAFATGRHEGYLRFDGPIQLFCDEPICAA